MFIPTSKFLAWRANNRNAVVQSVWVRGKLLGYRVA